MLALTLHPMSEIASLVLGFNGSELVLQLRVVGRVDIEGCNCLTGSSKYKFEPVSYVSEYSIVTRVVNPVIKVQRK